MKDAEYDYLENVENLSSVSTNNSHPFASDSLGSTAINLSSDLADVRRRKEMESKFVRLFICLFVCLFVGLFFWFVCLLANFLFVCC